MVKLQEKYTDVNWAVLQDGYLWFEKFSVFNPQNFPKNTLGEKIQSFIII